MGSTKGTDLLLLIYSTTFLNAEQRTGMKYEFRKNSRTYLSILEDKKESYLLTFISEFKRALGDPVEQPEHFSSRRIIKQNI